MPHWYQTLALLTLVMSLAACGPGKDPGTPYSLASTPLNSATLATPEPSLPIQSFLIDGYSKIRLSNMKGIAELLDYAVRANANTVCFSFNLSFDTSGRVLATAKVNSEEDIAINPSDLIPAIRLAKSKGLAVMLKPQTHIFDAAAGPAAFGNISIPFVERYPTFDVDRFFKDYQSQLVEFATMAQAEGVGIFSVGTENDGLQGVRYERQWRDTIAGVRSKFSGLLTYGAAIRFNQSIPNVLDFREVVFWDALDLIGLSIYPGWGALPGRFADYEPSKLYGAVRWDAQAPSFDMKGLIAPVLARYKKKLLVEEFGFQATSDQLQTGYDVSFYATPAHELPQPDYANQATGTTYFLQYFMSAFEDDLAGFNPWVLVAVPWALSGQEPPRWRLSQYLVIGETNGQLVTKPALEAIADFYGGRTLAFSGNRSEYAISRKTSIVTRRADGRQTSLPATARKLYFPDASVNLDVGRNAKNINVPDLKLLVELYIAFFNRVPDADGMDFWIRQVAAGRSIDQIADDFYSAAVANSGTTGYSATSGNADFVRIVYANVLGRTGTLAPPEADVNYWANRLTNGTDSFGSLIRTMLASAHSFAGHPTWGWVPTLLNNKFAVGHYFAIEQGLSYNSAASSITRGKAIAAAVTRSDTSTALSLIGVSDPAFSADLP